MSINVTINCILIFFHSFIIRTWTTTLENKTFGLFLFYYATFKSKTQLAAAAATESPLINFSWILWYYCCCLQATETTTAFKFSRLCLWFHVASFSWSERTVDWFENNFFTFSLAVWSDASINSMPFIINIVLLKRVQGWRWMRLPTQYSLTMFLFSTYIDKRDIFLVHISSFYILNNFKFKFSYDITDWWILIGWLCKTVLFYQCIIIKLVFWVVAAYWGIFSLNLLSLVYT